MKVMQFHQVPNGTLFRIVAEKRGYYEQGEKKFGYVRVADKRTYKKVGASHSTTKSGDVAILALHDLVSLVEKHK